MKLLIWGTGKVSTEYLNTEEICKDDLIGFVETKRTKDYFMKKKIYEPNQISSMDYDYILVCIFDAGNEIFDTAVQVGIDIHKMIFVNNWLWMDGTTFSKWPNMLCKLVYVGQNNELIQKNFPILYQEFVEPNDLAASRYMVTTKNGFDLVENDFLQSEEFNKIQYKKDYTRFRSFELMANEIIANNVKGSVAELGVFKGLFSKLINCTFKDKKMYLFDTFESFDKEEFDKEVDAGRYCDDLWSQILIYQK